MPTTAASPECPPEDGREIEWQLATDDLTAVREWLHSHREVAGVRIEPLPRHCLRDTYLDTADWRIFRAGYALRVRRADSRAEATLKSLRSARSDLADRREVTEALPLERPEPTESVGPLGTWVRERIGVTPLRMLFRADTSRERFAVCPTAPNGAAAEIALDETRLLGSTETPLGHLLRVEVEVRDGPPEALLPLIGALRQSCALVLAGENKFAAGLRAAALVPPPA